MYNFFVTYQGKFTEKDVISLVLMLVNLKGCFCFVYFFLEFLR